MNDETLELSDLGETGIGKSVLIDTLFNTQFNSVPASHDLPNVRLKAHTYGTWNNVAHLWCFMA